MPGLLDMLSVPAPQGGYGPISPLAPKAPIGPLPAYGPLPPLPPLQPSRFQQILQGMNLGVQSSPYAEYRMPNFSGGYGVPAFGGRLAAGQLSAQCAQRAAMVADGQFTPTILTFNGS